MTDAEIAAAHLSTLTIFTPDDLVGLQEVAHDADALGLLMRAYDDAAKLRSGVSWEDVAKALATVSSFLPLASGILGVVGALQSIAKG